MNATEFRVRMEEFARLRNIPLRDILNDIDEIGQRGLRVSRERQAEYFQSVFDLYCQGFPVALPKGTTSLRGREEDSE